MTAIKSNDPDVVKQGLEFWSNVCETEMDLVLETDSALERGVADTGVNRFYARGALKFVLPDLMTILTSQVSACARRG